MKAFLAAVCFFVAFWHAVGVGFFLYVDGYGFSAGIGMISTFYFLLIGLYFLKKIREEDA